jgi:hypothetical protein
MPFSENSYQTPPPMEFPESSYLTPPRMQRPDAPPALVRATRPMQLRNDINDVARQLF